jgi:rhodanese-related sulfurtransferase
MERRKSKRWPALFLLAIMAGSAIIFSDVSAADKSPSSDRFETVRAYIDAWLSRPGIDNLLISSAQLKKTIVDNWSNEKSKIQIVSVRNPADDDSAGHIPNATNIYWVDIVSDSSLARLNPNDTIILCCYYGQASMISCTILGLLGYQCRSLNFGMMGWNLEALVKAPWDQEAEYEVETIANEPKESFPPPIISSDQSDTKDIIKEMARKYFGGEGSPVIAASELKTIVDSWPQKEVEYQIVDARSKSDYIVGHIPHSINIPWTDMAKIDNLKRLDPTRIAVVYSENGQTGQMAATVLNLLGYHAVEIKFGMMDWNKANVDSSSQWNGAAGYPVETGR